MGQPVVAITHKTGELARFFAEEDLARLSHAAELRVLESNSFADIAGRLADVEVLLGSWGMPKLDAELLAAAPRLRAVCYAAGSVKRFVTPESYARGVVVTTAMHANAVPVAEVAVALITLANKSWFQAIDRSRAHGRARFYDPDGHPGNFGVSVGLVGFGAIGRLVAGKLRGMDLRVLVHDPHASAEDVRAHGAEPAGLLDIAGRSDVVSLHAPDIPATAGMIGADFLARMRDGATLINTARGRLVDETALIAELRRGRISAHLDVTFPEPPAADSPLWTLPNCWLTPHRAGSTGNEVRRMGRLAIDECLHVLAGRPVRYAVSEAMLATMA